MKLYKYRPLVNFEQVLDIVLKERLYCSTYNQLNDPFEGLFKTMIGGIVAGKVVSGYLDKKVDEITENVPRICSLSSSLEDVRLWSYYAKGHKGVVFEVDFKGIELQAHKVKYSVTLPHFNEGSILTGIKPVLPDEVLLHKTNHWEYEEEYRIFNDSEYFDISDRLSAVYFGSRIDKNQHDLLLKILPAKIPKYKTKINKDKLIVEPVEE